MTDNQIHPSNRTMINGAVFKGPHEGLLRCHSAAAWMSLFAHDHKAGIAIRKARDGEEGVSFTAADGTIWNLRLVDAE